MQTVQAFKTKDGEIFMDFAKAQQHQANLDNTSSIIEFLGSVYSPYKLGASRSISIAAIQAWESFKMSKNSPVEQESELKEA